MTHPFQSTIKFLFAPFGQLSRWVGALAALSGLSAQDAPPAFGSSALPATTSWIGNSYPGGEKWVQQDIAAMTVFPDGTIYTNVPWEEGGGNVGQYKEGALVGYAKHTHGWGFSGGQAIAANAKYLYIGCVCDNEGGNLKDETTWPPAGKKWFGLSRRLRSDITQAAPFAGGKGGQGDTLKECFLIVNEVGQQDAAALSSAVASETTVYVSNPWTNEIVLFDAETMQRKGAWPCETPGTIQLDAKGRLWVLAGPEGKRSLFRFSPEGVRMELKLPPIFQTAGTFCLEGGTKLLIIDSRQQLIRAFVPTGPDEGQLTSEGAIGSPGGVVGSLAGAVTRNGAQRPASMPLPLGTVGDLRFNRLSAIGTDAQNNLYLAHKGTTNGGSTLLESYTSEGKLRWRLLGLTFLDLPDVDPHQDTALYTKEEYFAMDWSRPPGKEWGYSAYTQHFNALKQDPRLHIKDSAGVWVRRLKGQPIMFVNDMNGARLQAYRYEGARMGRIALPAAMISPQPVKPKVPGAADSTWPPFQPTEAAWIWRDLNGDSNFDNGEYFPAPDGKALPKAWGWWVDLDGGIWLATETEGLRYWPYGGLDANGCPAWLWDQLKSWPKPALFEQIRRVRYIPQTDTLYLGGTTAQHKNQHWKPMGPVLARFDNWMKSNGAAEPKWVTTLPYEAGSSGHHSCEPMSFDVAGDYLFISYTGASKDRKIKTGHVEVLQADNGQVKGYFEPDAQVGEIGLQDIVESLRAWKRRDGEYLIFIEDDSKAKIVTYRWKP